MYLKIYLQIIIKLIKMQKGKSKKKEKINHQKLASAINSLKKSESKKGLSLKKQEVDAYQKKQQLKSTGLNSVNNPNSKMTSGGNTDVRSSKYIQQSIRTSPKASLAEISSIRLKKQPEQSKIKLQTNKNSSKIDESVANKIKQQVKRSLANVIKVYHPESSCLDISMTDIASGRQAKQQKIGRIDFNFLTVIGEGGYGKVWKVQHHKTKAIYAMKEMPKAIIIMKKSAQNVLNQMKILSRLRNSFIANMTFAFNDRDNLYLGMDYLPGGDLRSLISNHEPEKIKQYESKFLIACIIKSLEYIHSSKVFHRDIKPENLVLDQFGYLRLTDFGIARSLRQNQCLDTSGTPGYMAPQVLCKQIHSYSVDFYALGIIAYELMMGKRPYSGQNRNQIRQSILSKQHSIKKKQIPLNWSFQAVDFINKLIQRQPSMRLGHKQGVEQLKIHPWFINFPWRQLQQKRLISPFKLKYKAPAITDRNDEYDQALNQYKLLQRTDQKVDIFCGYYFNLK